MHTNLGKQITEGRHVGLDFYDLLIALKSRFHDSYHPSGKKCPCGGLPALLLQIEIKYKVLRFNTVSSVHIGGSWV